VQETLGKKGWRNAALLLAVKPLAAY